MSETLKDKVVPESTPTQTTEIKKKIESGQIRVKPEAKKTQATKKAEKKKKKARIVAPISALIWSHESALVTLKSNIRDAFLKDLGLETLDEIWVVQAKTGKATVQLKFFASQGAALKELGA